MRYLKDSTGCTGSIKIQSDETARLKIALPNGKNVLNKVYKNEKSALTSWYRYCS